jgi:glucosamine-phosphate N-acetyltransferase
MLLYDYVHENMNRITEIKNQYIDLLSNLTECPMISNELFLEQIKKIHDQGDIVIFIDNKIIGSGTILIENKIIHQCKSVGHIEDIVVHPDYRDRGISQIILNELKDIGKDCYKIILDCKENLIPVYEKNGFEKRGIQMAIYKKYIYNI